jgi:hypothetical protein
LDLASILFARTAWFPDGGNFACHLRLDSSPQFGKDYLNGEADIVFLDNLRSWEQAAALLIIRMLVSQLIGARASGLLEA